MNMNIDFKELMEAVSDVDVFAEDKVEEGKVPKDHKDDEKTRKTLQEKDGDGVGIEKIAEETEDEEIVDEAVVDEKCDKCDGSPCTCESKDAEGKVTEGFGDDEEKPEAPFEDDGPPPVEDEEVAPVEDEIGETPGAGEEEEISKDFIGQKDDAYFYLESDENDGGERENLRVVDAEGNTVFSAEDDENVDTSDVATFILAAAKEMDMASIDMGVIDKYIVPKLMAEEEEFGGEEEIPMDEPMGGEEPIDEPGAEEEEDDDFEELDFEKKKYEARLRENKLEIGGKTLSFSEKFLGQFKEDSIINVRKLAETVLATLDESEIKSLTEIKKGK